jgi:hypothetical protein
MKPVRRPALLLLAAASLAAAAAAPTSSKPPAHLALAERMVASILPENNSYANGKFTVTWAGIDGEKKTFNKSDCTTFVTALLRTAYHFTPKQFEGWFGKASPSVTLYYDSASANKGLVGFKQIADLRPGDLLISKFTNKAEGGAAGHMMIADGLPQLVRMPKNASATEKVYDLTIIDCTGSPHADDSRIKPQSGVGRGNIRLYTDKSGNLETWGWSASNAVKPYQGSARPMTFAKVPTAAGEATAGR